MVSRLWTWRTRPWINRTYKPKRKWHIFKNRNDDKRNTIVKSKTYSNLKHNANNQDVYDVAEALMGLQEYEILEIAKIDNTTLA